LLVSLTW